MFDSAVISRKPYPPARSKTMVVFRLRVALERLLLIDRLEPSPTPG